MNLVIRADASISIGTGHIMRCLILAELLRQQDVKVFFICREEMGHLCEYIEQKGYKVGRIHDSPIVHETKIDRQIEDATESINILERWNMPINWLIVDHYELDIYWELKLKPKVNNVMVIDDLANRRHDCDLLLDQNFHLNFEKRYDTLVPSYCTKLLGPRHVLLRPEFLRERNKRERDGVIRRILIFYGGSDPTNETVKAIKAIQTMKLSNLEVDVVVGQANPYKNTIRDLCSQSYNFNYYCQINNMAELMCRADLSLGAGGGTMWERCYLGLPAIITEIATNQVEAVAAVGTQGAVWTLGWHELVTIEVIADKIQKALEVPNELKEMSRKAQLLMSGEDHNSSNQLIEEIIGRYRCDS